MNDGGPAFPAPTYDFTPGTGEQVVREQHYGMSLRAWLAGQALKGILSNPEMLPVIKLGVQEIAKQAILQADAVLAALDDT